MSISLYMLEETNLKTGTCLWMYGRRGNVPTRDRTAGIPIPCQLVARTKSDHDMYSNVTIYVNKR